MVTETETAAPTGTTTVALSPTAEAVGTTTTGAAAGGSVVITKAKKTKTKAEPVAAPVAKKKPAPKLDDAAFHKLLLETVYALRKNNPVKWVDLRNSCKEGEQLHRLILSRPVYTWRKFGVSHYLEAKHDGSDTVVAFALPHDPGAEYRKAVREYEQAMQKRKSKKLVEPKKPTSMKKSWRWVITNRRGAEEQEGFEPTLDAAQVRVLARKHLFAV